MLPPPCYTEPGEPSLITVRRWGGGGVFTTFLYRYNSPVLCTVPVNRKYDVILSCDEKTPVAAIFSCCLCHKSSTLQTIRNVAFTPLYIHEAYHLYVWLLG